MQEIRQHLIDYYGNVQSLVKQSPNVPPLKKRREPIKEAKSVITVCDYSGEQVTWIVKLSVKSLG